MADGKRAVKEAIESAKAWKASGIRIGYYPLEYPLANDHTSQTVDVVRRLAAAAELGTIITTKKASAGRGCRLKKKQPLNGTCES